MSNFLPVIKAASSVLIHTPGLTRYGSKPQREIAANPARLAALNRSLRSFQQAQGYLPNQVFIGQQPAEMTQGRMTYHLRRLRLHGMIERIPQSHRYRLTDIGLRSGWFFTRAYSRILRPGLGRILPELSVPNGPLRRCFDKLDHEVKSWVNEAKLAA